MNTPKDASGFQQLWFRHAAVVQEYEAGRLTREDVIEQLSEWLLQDKGEYYWTVVWATRQWFRLYGDVWMETEPLFTMEEIEGMESRRKPSMTIGG
ncbi:MAG: hypothetical protein IPK19_17450 [Chloroflexi bacterium]|nr:hypothetical protein [Chloroflexota bacterium]